MTTQCGTCLELLAHASRVVIKCRHPATLIHDLPHFTADSELTFPPSVLLSWIISRLVSLKLILGHLLVLGYTLVASQTTLSGSMDFN
jgi:hypothetical protein